MAAQVVLELSEELLDRVEVGRVFGQEDEPGAGTSDGAAHRLCLVRAEIVHDGQIALEQARREHAFDIDEEALAVDRSVDEPGCLDPVTTQCGQEGHGVPVAERRGARQPLATRRPAAQRRHVGLGPCLVDEDQAGGVDPRAELQPLRTPARDIGTGALVGDQRLFLYVSASAWTNAHTER
jgi:hypothetical protein